MVGPWRLELQTSTVSKPLYYVRPTTSRVLRVAEVPGSTAKPESFLVKLQVNFYYWLYFASLTIASAAFPATTQLADPATTASSSNHRNPKSSMHSGKSGLMMIYPGITAPGM